MDFDFLASELEPETVDYYMAGVKDGIDLDKFGTATEIANEIDVDRSRLDKAMRRRDDLLEVRESRGGTLLVSVTSAKRWKKNPPSRGPKTKD